MDSSDNPVAGWMLFLLFIVINSIFYGFGSAIQNLNENEIEDKAEQGDKKSKLLLHIMNAPGSLIQTVQFYHMLLSFLIGYVQLKSIMKNIHEACVQYGTEADGYVNYVKGANVAGFMKVAKAMMAQGIV